ncbi:MAG: NRDE family protein, partial [Gammaproteobacteria bacterium]|nr:NRDE family protein [Gammaproteobacteria bacterium]
MCLVVLAVGQSQEYPLILAGNRDEFHARPTQKAHWWSDKPNIVGGRDLQAGGTWLALHRDGRYAAVTNFRDAEPVSPGFRSRGHLVMEFLESDQP